MRGGAGREQCGGQVGEGGPEITDGGSGWG